MRRYVFDTSALLRLYIGDGPVVDGSEQALDAAWRGDAVVHIPELLLAEAGQVLLQKQRSGHLSMAQADMILGEIMTLPVHVSGHRELMVPAIALARYHALTIYDAMFLALARRHAAELLTASARREGQIFSFPLLGSTPHAPDPPRGRSSQPRRWSSQFRRVVICWMRSEMLPAFVATAHAMWPGAMTCSSASHQMSS